MGRGGYRLLQPPGVASLLFQVFLSSHSPLPRTLGAGNWDKAEKEAGRHLPHTQKREWTLVHHSGAEFPEGDSKLKRAFRGAQPGKVSGKESGKASLWSVGCERMPCGPGKEGPGAGQTGGHWPVHWSRLMAAHRSEPGGYFHRNPQATACRLWAVLHTPRVTCTGTSQATQSEMKQDRDREELRTERALLTELA